MRYDWNFAAIAPYWGAIGAGVVVTIKLTALSILLGTVGGFLLGPLLTVRMPALRWALISLVDVIRSTPVLILIVAANYFLPIAFSSPNLDPFLICVIALSLNLCVFVADTFRGAIRFVPHEELEAARAVGLTSFEVFTRISLPHVIAICLPTLTLLYIAIAKNSALSSVIAVYDLTHTANLIITEKMRTLEVYVVVVAIYVALILPLTILSRVMESRRRVHAAAA